MINNSYTAAAKVTARSRQTFIRNRMGEHSDEGVAALESGFQNVDAELRADCTVEGHPR